MTRSHHDNMSKRRATQPLVTTPPRLPDISLTNLETRLLNPCAYMLRPHVIALTEHKSRRRVRTATLAKRANSLSPFPPCQRFTGFCLSFNGEHRSTRSYASEDHIPVFPRNSLYAIVHSSSNNYSGFSSRSTTYWFVIATHLTGRLRPPFVCAVRENGPFEVPEVTEDSLKVALAAFSMHVPQVTTVSPPQS
jgi:hypothetical protein